MATSLVEHLDATAVAGHTLNVEEKTCVRSSLALLQDAQGLAQVSFWGKLQGVHRDYLVASSLAQAPFRRRFFYSLDAVNWVQLPDVAQKDIRKAALIHRRFLGDPAYEYHVSNRDVTATDPSDDGVPMSEEKRLAATVQAITNETMVVPRGAFYKDATGNIVHNHFFKGLSKAEANELSSYLHYRETPADAKLGRPDSVVDPSLDIFEPLTNDQPKESWSVQAEQSSQLVLIRSLQWPGYVAYHNTTNGAYGGLYFGTGLRNLDIGYMF